MPIEIIKTIHELARNVDPLVDTDLITVSKDGSDEIYKTTILSLAAHIVNYSAGRVGIFKNLSISTHISNAHAVPKLVVGFSEGADIIQSQGGPYFPEQAYGQLSSDALAFPDILPPWSPWWIDFNWLDFGGQLFTFMPDSTTYSFTPPLHSYSMNESFAVYQIEINLATNGYISVLTESFEMAVGLMFFMGEPPVQNYILWLNTNLWKGVHLNFTPFAISGSYTLVVPFNLTEKRWYTPCFAFASHRPGLFYNRAHTTFKVARIK